VCLLAKGVDKAAIQTTTNITTTQLGKESKIMLFFRWLVAFDFYASAVAIVVFVFINFF